jgi:hypothetical protein
MMTGEDFKGITPHIDKTIREERKKALLINQRTPLTQLVKRRKDLKNTRSGHSCN